MNQSKGSRDSSGRFTKKTETAKWLESKKKPKRTLETDLADCYWMLQELKKDLKAMELRLGGAIEGASSRSDYADGLAVGFMSEVGERLRVIELKLEALQNPPITAWSKAEREAFLSGLRAV